MTLEQLNLVLQIVGSIGVIGSLIFVGLQVRQNTKAIRVRVQENMTSCYISVAQVLIDNVEVFTRGIAATLRFEKKGAYWSVRISRGWPAAGRFYGDTLYWFWIGLHDEYEGILGRR